MKVLDISFFDSQYPHGYHSNFKQWSYARGESLMRNLSLQIRVSNAMCWLILAKGTPQLSSVPWELFGTRSIRILGQIPSWNFFVSSQTPIIIIEMAKQF